MEQTTQNRGLKVTHKCEENRILICSICHFEMSKERNKLLEFVEKIANKPHEFEEISHASWDATILLQEIGEGEK